MVKILIIGDSHLKRININDLNFDADVDARGGRKASHLSEETFMQDKYKIYDAFFVLLGGNDVHYHNFYNPHPKTSTETAQHLISSQFVSKTLNWIQFRFSYAVKSKNVATMLI